MILQLLITISLFRVSIGSVLLWNFKDIRIPALNEFNNDDFKNLLHKTNNPQVIAFSSDKLDSSRSFPKFLLSATTSYIPNANLTFDSIQELTGSEEDSKLIDDILKPYTDEPNSIIVLVINDHKVRIKRKIESVSSTTEINEIEYVEPITGPILYSAVLPTDKTVEAMIYSSKPPLLKVNGNNINLGDAAVTNMDIRDAYTRLIATIPIANGKISLRFRFYWLSGYWYFNLVEVEFVDAQIKQYNLTLNEEFMAPRRFSYHCGGSAIFVDTENEVELHLFDVQAQPDAHNHRFSDAYDCVPFTTGPIWSGIFVAFILCSGLLVSLSALNNIKTMDKFDNHKTKQLSITVWE